MPGNRNATANCIRTGCRLVCHLVVWLSTLLSALAFELVGKLVLLSDSSSSSADAKNWLLPGSLIYSLREIGSLLCFDKQVNCS